MLKRSLAKTNPYLLDSMKRREMFAMTVFTSTDIEGVKLSPSDLAAMKKAPHHPTVFRVSGKSSGSRH